MKFIKLTCAATGRPDYVRVDLITSVLNTKHHTGCIVYLSMGEANAEVSETTEEVMGLILTTIYHMNR